MLRVLARVAPAARRPLCALHQRTDYELQLIEPVDFGKKVLAAPMPVLAVFTSACAA